MCDTIAFAPPDGPVWLAKNSDREPGEAQLVEHRTAARPAETTLQATHVRVEQAPRTFEVALSRPAWMWGAEMGVNERGLAAANEAVFTRVPVAQQGLTGMDLLRLALERCATAQDAVEQTAWFLARVGQGGAAGYRNKSFRYHNAFMFADATGAWLMETAGPYWAAEPVRGLRTISNVLSIGKNPQRVGPGTEDAARKLGFLAPGEDFDFRKCFADPWMGILTGGDVRRNCTDRGLRGSGPLELEDFARALRDHVGRKPSEGARMVMPCAHANFFPTRSSGQTTGSMVAKLTLRGVAAFFTGTSSPCLSVLKPVPLGGARVDTGPPPASHTSDKSSLFWSHERLHRAVMRDYLPRQEVFRKEREALEQRAWANLDAAAATDIWREHRERTVDWTHAVRATKPRKMPGLFDAYWALQSKRDGI